MVSKTKFLEFVNTLPLDELKEGSKWNRENIFPLIHEKFSILEQENPDFVRVVELENEIENRSKNAPEIVKVQDDFLKASHTEEIRKALTEYENLTFDEKVERNKQCHKKFKAYQKGAE